MPAAHPDAPAKVACAQPSPLGPPIVRSYGPGLSTVAIRDGRTASEVVRRTEVDEFGTSAVIAEEYAVLDRVGRLQLPADYRRTLGLRDRVRLELEQDHVGIWPDARIQVFTAEPHEMPRPRANIEPEPTEWKACSS